MKQRRLGLKENWPLFTLLVLMSAFVGAMVGFERSLLPVITSSWGMEEAQSSLIMVATLVDRKLWPIYSRVIYSPVLDGSGP